MTDNPQLTRRALLSASGVAAVSTLLPTLAACGSSDANSNGTAKNGKNLTLGTTQVVQFDPYQTNSALHIHAYYTYLIDYAPGGYKPVPAAAESWKIAPDSSSVTITLRDQKFHNGKPVTVDDLIAGVKRAKDPKDGFTLVQPSAFIKSAKAVDQHRFKLEFEYPVADGMILDWMFGFPLVPANGNSSTKLADRPNGSGPFKLQEYQPNQRITMVRNPEYWNKGKPLLDEIEYRLFSDDQSMVSALQAGDVDAATYLEFSDVDQLKDQFTVQQGSGRMDIWFMNGAIPPFDNVKLRQALARAIDRDKIIRQVRFGIGEPVYAPIMPGAAGFDPSYLRSQAFDLDAAAKLLNQAGGGRTATAGLSAGDTGATQMLQIIQADFKKIGFDLKIKQIEATAFLDDLFGGKLQCCVANQPNTMQTPGMVARGRAMLPTSDNVMMGNHVPKAYSTALDAANRAVTPAEQKKAYAALNKAMVDGAWAVGIATKKSLAGLKKGITGYRVDQRDYIVPDDLHSS